MKKWAYVICELVDGLPSFRHTFVWAPDEDAAYDEGQRTLEQPNGNGLNDYVLEVSDDTI